MIGFPSKLVPIGFEFPLGGFMKGHHPFPPYLSLFIGSGIVFSKVAKGCTLPCGKKEIKAQRVKVDGKIYKTKEQNLQVLRSGIPEKEIKDSQQETKGPIK
jgi:hypothetical protein